MNTTLTAEWKNEANDKIIENCGNCQVQCSCHKQALEAVRYFQWLGFVANLAANNQVRVKL